MRFQLSSLPFKLSPGRTLLTSALMVGLLACGKKDPPQEAAPAAAPAGQAASVAAKTPPTEAVVLGLRDQEGALTTLFIDSNGIQHRGRGLAVPRSAGWWKLERVVQKSPDGKWVDIKAVAAPAGQPLQPPPLEDMSGCESESTLTVLFVGNDYVSLEQGNSGYCEGAAHPFASQSLVTYSLDGLATATASNLRDIAGDAVSQQLTRDGNASRDGSELDECLEAPSATAWGLVRSGGKWLLRGGRSHAAEACRGEFKAFTVNAAVPEKLTGHDKLPRPFEAYQADQTSLKDVVSSPSGKLEVLVTAEGLEVRSEGQSVAKESLPGVAIVLAQWALGEKSVATWRQDVSKLVTP